MPQTGPAGYGDLVVVSSFNFEEGESLLLSLPGLNFARDVVVRAGGTVLAVRVLSFNLTVTYHHEWRERERAHSGVCQLSLSDLKVGGERVGCGLVLCT